MVSEIITNLLNQNAHLEQNLKSAENALVEKDKYIKKLKFALDKRDVTIERQKERIDSSDKAIAIQRETIARLRSSLASKESDPLRMLKFNMQLYDARKERDQYKAALADLEGSLAASSDHSKELSDKIHELLHA